MKTLRDANVRLPEVMLGEFWQTLPQTDLRDLLPQADLRRRLHHGRYHTYKALNKARKYALNLRSLDLKNEKIIILSDVHKGNGSSVTDDFRQNVGLYCHALYYYLQRNFRLVLNGDIEECWKHKSRQIVETYEDSAFRAEREFAQQGEEYYLRTVGNHDNDWADPCKVRRWLQPVLGAVVNTYPAIMLNERILITHGHQGEFFSDRIAQLSRRVVRHIWRPFQAFMEKDLNLFAANNPINHIRDRNLSEWAHDNRMLLIAGHTHRAHFDPDGDTFEAAQNYINAGSCINRDGMTGVEIEDGEIRLIKWEADDAPEKPFKRSIFHSGYLFPLLAGL